MRLRLLLATTLLLGSASPALAIVASGGGNVSEDASEKKLAPAPAPAPVRVKQAKQAKPAMQLPAKIPMRHHQLANGLQLVMVEDHKAPVVTFQVFYQVGSKDERQGLTGTSHLLEHMMFQGAKRYGKGEFDRTLLRNGGQNNAYTVTDYTAYYETFASDRLEVAFDLESDRMTDALIDPKQLDSEKGVVREELRWRGDNSPVGATWEALVSHMYVAHPYHWPIGGWPSDVSSVPREDVYKYYRTYYRPDNATVVIAGDFKAEDAIRLAERYFGPLQPGKTFPRNTTVEPPQDGERRIELIKQVETPVVMIGFHAPASGHADLHALFLMNNILSNGESSRMYQQLVYKGRIAQAVESGLDRNKDGSIFYALGQPLAGKTAAQVEKGILDELARVARDGVTEAELAKAKNQAFATFVFSRDSVEGMANELGSLSIYEGPEAYNEYLSKMLAVTTADVKRVAQTYLKKNTRTVVTLHGPEGAK
jgi:predicted Zn-dependent peptidase